MRRDTARGVVNRQNPRALARASCLLAITAARREPPGAAAVACASAASAWRRRMRRSHSQAITAAGRYGSAHSGASSALAPATIAMDTPTS